MQARRPNPQVTEVSRLDWTDRSIPQVALPITIDGTRYLLEIDEFATQAAGNNLPGENSPRVGAGRIIDISDEHRPFVVSNLRLEVNQREHRDEVAGDPGASVPRPGVRRPLLRGAARGRSRDRGVQLHPLGPADLRPP